MKRLSEFIKEDRGDDINDDWLNNESPVIIKDGNSAIVVDIDMSKVPNIIKGKVKYGDKLVDYEWEDNGKCILAHDQYGNPKQPTEGDKLVKGI